MAWSGHTWQLKSLRDFHAADKYFNETPPHRNWDSNERCLRKDRPSQFKHYRLRRGVTPAGVVFYDVVLYRTAMARFYQPTPEGEELHYYTWNNSQTSKGFTRNVLHMDWLSMLLSVNGVYVAAPMGGDGVYDPMDNKPFGLKLLWVNPHRPGLCTPGELRVDTPRSEHKVLYRRVSDSDDRARRAALITHLQTYIDLALLRLPSMPTQRGTTSYASTARPFAGRRTVTNEYDLSAALRALAPLGEREAEAFFDLAQEVLYTLSEKRDWIRDDAPPITPKDFETSLKRALVSLVGADRKTGRVPLPQFMPWADFPRNAKTLSYSK